MSHNKELIYRNRSGVDTGDKGFTIAFINILHVLKKVQGRVSIIKTDMEDEGKEPIQTLRGENCISWETWAIQDQRREIGEPEATAKATAQNEKERENLGKREREEIQLSQGTTYTSIWSSRRRAKGIEGDCLQSERKLGQIIHLIKEMHLEHRPQPTIRRHPVK